MSPGRHLQGSVSEAAAPGPGLGGIHVPEGRRQAAGGARTPCSSRGAFRPRSPTWTDGHLGEGLNTPLFLGAAGAGAVVSSGSLVFHPLPCGRLWLAGHVGAECDRAEWRKGWQQQKGGGLENKPLDHRNRLDLLSRFHLRFSVDKRILCPISPPVRISQGF